MSRLRPYCGPDGPASTRQIVATSIAIVNAINPVDFIEGWSISGSYAAPWRKHQHVLRVSIQRNMLGKCMHWLVTTILPQKLALAFLPVAWSLPTTIVVKKLKPNSDDEFTNELRMYETLKTLQGKQIPVCYGEAYYDGTRALVLEDVGGVSLYHRSALVEMSEEQIAQMILASYRPMISLNLAYDDWKLDNFHLVDGRVVFLDLEYVYELDYEPEHAIQLGRAAILERWHQFREQYEEYGEIEM
ncbi:hypothetical protein MY10362_008843 [Beauveria mimosiformis]